MSRSAKMRLAARIWLRYARVMLGLHREPLPSFVHRLAAVDVDAGRERHPPARLSRAVYRSLRIGRKRPRCLVNALVLFRLLREQGDAAELVIGLPHSANDHRAHAWVELDERDVGPPPGRAGHGEMVRLP